MTIECTNPKNASEVSLCACKSSADDYKRLVNAYDTQKINYTADSASYQRWISDHNDWKNKQGNYIRFKDVDFQQEIGSEMCWGQPRGNGDYQCKESARNKGLPYHEGWIDIGKDSCCSGCGWAWQKNTFKCNRSQDSINNANIEWKNTEPQIDPQNNKIWLNVPPPVDNAIPPVYQGVCCSQIFEKITNSGGDINLDNISQTCGSSNTDANDTNDTNDTKNPSNLKEKLSSIFKNKTLTISIIILICCMLLSIVAIIIIE